MSVHTDLWLMLRDGAYPGGIDADYQAGLFDTFTPTQDSDRSPGGPMLSWLERDLASTAQDWIIACWHHALDSKGLHDSDRERAMIEMRQNVIPILENHGVEPKARAWVTDPTAERVRRKEEGAP